ncbi:hypothetical protein [Desulfovibrio cuneatus]|uniref:hypothetical protein n=1 Tax=Desulfovibrio cuneatus TaxID=159728 RepID=UPI00048119F6|nr:hypothetical protein [Desulfovibrio cuneatus]
MCGIRWNMPLITIVFLFCIGLSSITPKTVCAADYSQWNGEWAISLEKTWALKQEGMGANVRAAVEKAVRENAYARITIEPQSNTLQFALYAPDAKKPGEQAKRMAWEGQLVPPGNSSTSPTFTENNSVTPGAAAQKIQLQQDNTLLWSAKGLNAQVVLVKRAAATSDVDYSQWNGEWEISIQDTLNQLPKEAQEDFSKELLRIDAAETFFRMQAEPGNDSVTLFAYIPEEGKYQEKKLSVRIEPTEKPDTFSYSRTDAAEIKHDNKGTIQILSNRSALISVGPKGASLVAVKRTTPKLVELEEQQKAGYGNNRYSLLPGITFGMSPTQVQEVATKEDHYRKQVQLEKFELTHNQPSDEETYLALMDSLFEPHVTEISFLFKNNKLISLRYNDPLKGNSRESIETLNAAAKKTYGEPVLEDAKNTFYLCNNTFYLIIPSFEGPRDIPVAILTEKNVFEALRKKKKETADSATQAGSQLATDNGKTPTREGITKGLNPILKNRRGKLSIDKILDDVFFKNGELAEIGNGKYTYICYRALEKVNLLSMTEISSKPSFPEIKKSYMVKVMPQCIKEESDYSYYVRLADISVAEIVQWDVIIPTRIEVWFTRNIDNMAPWITPEVIEACSHFFGKDLKAYKAGKSESIDMQFIDGSHPRWEVNYVDHGGTL